ncbi:heat shock cognate 70 kDa protein-like protein [Tanacetum coccineum]
MHKKDIDVVIVGGSTQIPKVQQILMDFFDGKKLCNSISTDETTAHGAAVLGANLSGYGSKQAQDLNLILSDVTPLSFGIAAHQTDAYDMSVMIPRNTPIPTIKECCFKTSFKNQLCVLTKVYEGESTKTIENVLLYLFTVNGIPAAPAWEQRIKVCFKIDTNGILNVTTHVKSTDDIKSASFSSNGNLLKRLIKKTLKSIKQLS